MGRLVLATCLFVLGASLAATDNVAAGALACVAVLFALALTVDEAVRRSRR